MKKNLNIVLILLFFLTACSAITTTPLVPTETPYPVRPTSTEIPTLPPTETPLPPIESLSVTKQSVGDFASAMQNIGVDITAEQILQQGLQIQTITGKDGNQYEVATTYLDLTQTQQGESLKGDYPLMIKGADGKWSSNLRQLAILTNMKIGTSIAKSETIPQITETDLMNIQKNEFNSGLLSLYWTYMEKNQGTVDYSMRISSAKFAQSNNMDTIGHLVLWGKDVPLWLKNGNFSKEQLIEIMKGRVRNAIITMTKYGVTSYIVVNEAGSGNDIFNKKIGQEYVEIAFQVARDTGKELNIPLTLIYNDYDNSAPSQERTAITLKIVNDLKQKELIDAVGLETIINYPNVPSVNEMIETMQSYGVPVIVSESAVNMKIFHSSETDKEIEQAQIYYNLVEAALKSGVCKDFIVFIPIDELTPWEIEPSLDGYSLDSNPSIYHLVNGKIQPKFSYYAIKKAMFDFIK